MKRSIAACAGMLICWSSAGAAELAYTVRPTELKEKPFSDASTLANLAASSKVDVLGRQASWLEVKSLESQGWVKMLSLRFDQISNKPGSGAANSNLAVLFNIAQTGSGGATAGTGVKGMSEQLMATPQPNPRALDQMVALQVSAEQVEAFARAGKLVSADMEYVSSTPPGEQQ